MKLLTINTHSLIEPESDKKLLILADAIAEELPAIIALQEVNQSKNMPKINNNPFIYKDVCVRNDNYAALLLDLLNKKGLKYYCVWLPIKIGYDKYDEGLALLSRLPIIETDNFLISKSSDYSYWKTRRVLGIRTDLGWFYNVHMGWWQDKEEPFKEQWEKLNAHIKDKGNVWLMGDFNSRDDIKGEGYSLITGSGWYDSYKLAESKDNGFTVEKQIDGWKTGENQKMRIDYIFSNFEACIKQSKVIFNGINKSIISDHYGIIAQIRR